VKRRAVVPVLVMCTLLCAAGETGRAQERMFSILLKGNLTTTGRLFPNPGATDPLARAQSYGFADFFGYGFEVQYHITGTHLSVGLSADAIRSTQSRTISVSAQRVVPAEDGFRVVPVELTGYFRIPITEGSFGVYMGGGAGVYFGERQYSLAGLDAPVVSRAAGYGIHVLGGVQYRFTDHFSLCTELKFRDAHFESTNAFTQLQVRYGSTIVNLPQKPFLSSIHTDGMVVQLGAAFSL
jgi:opacity protein-like surface antigen